MNQGMNVEKSAMVVLFVVLLSGCAANSHYVVIRNKDQGLCREVGNSLQSHSVQIPKNMCEWRFIPTASSASKISTPEWSSYDASADDVKQMRTVRPAYFDHADPAEIQRLWRSKYERQWLSDSRNRTHAYRISEFDIDNDGAGDHVLMEDRQDCSEDWLLPHSPKLFVLKKESQRLDTRYGVWGDNTLNPFIYNGQTYFARMEPTSSESAVSEQIERRVIGREEKPVGVIQIVAAIKPGVHNPFMYSEAICSFNAYR